MECEQLRYEEAVMTWHRYPPFHPGPPSANFGSPGVSSSLTNCWFFVVVACKRHCEQTKLIYKRKTSCCFSHIIWNSDRWRTSENVKPVCEEERYYDAFIWQKAAELYDVILDLPSRWGCDDIPEIELHQSECVILRYFCFHVNSSLMIFHVQLPFSSLELIGCWS